MCIIDTIGEEKHMSDKKDLRTNDESPNDRSLESLHRSLFDCPDDNDWKATRSLAQPSFLKQIDSRGGAHSTPVRVFSDTPRKR